jgi:hypothetical protein
MIETASAVFFCAASLVTEVGATGIEYEVFEALGSTYRILGTSIVYLDYCAKDG